MAILLLVLLTVVLLAICAAGVWTMRASVPLGVVITMASAFGIYAAWHVHRTPGRRRTARTEALAPNNASARQACLDTIRTTSGTRCRTSGTN